MDDSGRHPSALVSEVERLFADLEPGSRVVDATVGHGGHAERLLGLGHHVLGVDADARALDHCRERLSAWVRPRRRRPPDGGSGGRRDAGAGSGGRRPTLQLRHGRFSRLSEHLASVGWDRADGLLADLGTRLDQLLDPGSSFDGDGPPDMRLDPDAGGPTALDLLESLGRADLVGLFSSVDSRAPGRLADRVLAARDEGTLASIDCRGLAALLAEPGGGSGHPATRPFLALRRAVNDEGSELTALLSAAPRHVAPGGIVALIAWHGAEDAPVKRALAKWAGMGLGTVLTPKPVFPTAAESGGNPRARSARLRAFRMHRNSQEGTS